MRIGLAVLIPLCLVASPTQKPKAKPAEKAPRIRLMRPVSTEREAKAIAEQDTGGIAVHARRIPLNGATGGWEVELRMPRESQGWRCIIDNDTHMVKSKERIPNPERSTRRR